MATSTVWTIGSDHWQRACLRAELIERGYDAVGFETARDALIALLLRRKNPPALIVIDLQDQTADVRAITALLSKGIPALAIGGATAWTDATIARLGWRAFLRRPVTLGVIADTVARFTSAPVR